MNNIITKKLALIFRRLDVMAVYLFGSQTVKDTTNKSDYDLAVFIKNINKISRRELLKEVISVFPYPDKLHLTIVDTTSSSPVLLYQIIKKGRPIYKKSANILMSLESLIMRLYFDDQFRSHIYYQSLKNRYADR